VHVDIQRGGIDAAVAGLIVPAHGTGFGYVLVGAVEVTGAG
jgi:hypothetical protein